mmetsp:Transcript_79733/g.140646  ORF Transcript_79733/g.140646 Transcript_79733/m.140646 type:complete len:295 (-) Transcript_79733:698-1582(-)
MSPAGSVGGSGGRRSRVEAGRVASTNARATAVLPCPMASARIPPTSWCSVRSRQQRPSEWRGGTRRRARRWSSPMTVRGWASRCRSHCSDRSWSARSGSSMRPRGACPWVWVGSEGTARGTNSGGSASAASHMRYEKCTARGGTWRAARRWWYAAAGFRARVVTTPPGSRSGSSPARTDTSYRVSSVDMISSVVRLQPLKDRTLWDPMMVTKCSPSMKRVPKSSSRTASGSRLTTWASMTANIRRGCPTASLANTFSQYHHCWAAATTSIRRQRLASAIRPRRSETVRATYAAV